MLLLKKPQFVVITIFPLTHTEDIYYAYKEQKRTLGRTTGSHQDSEITLIVWGFCMKHRGYQATINIPLYCAALFKFMTKELTLWGRGHPSHCIPHQNTRMSFISGWDLLALSNPFFFIFLSYIPSIPPAKLWLLHLVSGGIHRVEFDIAYFLVISAWTGQRII